MNYQQPSGPTNYIAYNILRWRVGTSQGKEHSLPNTKSTELTNHQFSREFWFHFWPRPTAQKWPGSPGKSRRMKLPEIFPNILPPLCPFGCWDRTTPAEPLLEPLSHIKSCSGQTSDRHQTHTLTATNHRTQPCKSVDSSSKDGNMVLQDILQGSEDYVIWSSEPTTFLDLCFLHNSSSLEKWAPDSTPCVIFSIWQMSRGESRRERINRKYRKEKATFCNAVTLLQVILTSWYVTGFSFCESVSLHNHCKLKYITILLITTVSTSIIIIDCRIFYWLP